MENKHALLAALAVSGSLGLHGAAYAALGLAPPMDASHVTRRTVELELAPRPKPPDREAPPRAPEPPPRAKAPPAPAKPAENPEPAPADPPEAPRGVPLTDPNGIATDTTLTGVGGELGGPLGPVSPAAPVPASTAVAAAPVRPTGPRVVATRDLAERPSPPSLDDALRRQYPPDAKRRGLGGKASVRARVEPDGSIRTASVLSESDAGFGEACRRTLVGSRWSPPRDREGRTVATEIRYTCRFVVGR